MLNARKPFLNFQPSSLIVGVLLASLCMGLSACEMKLPPMPWDPKPDPKAAQKDGKGGDANATGDQPASGGGEEENGPVDELKLLPADMQKLPYEEVSIPLKDQLIIYGRLYDPKMKPEGEDAAAPAADTGGDDEYKGPKYPLVILLHGLNHTHIAWSDLPATLVKAGYAVFAMDLRGHGKSTITTHKHRVTWRLFKNEQWPLLSKDVNEVIQYFQKGEDYPEVDGKNVALVGEKLGANVAVYAARDMDDVKAMILISPGLDYKGIIPSQAIVDYNNPALLITSQDDSYSYQSTERLYNWLLGPKALQVYKQIGDGTDMLTNRTTLGSQMTDWLVSHFPPVKTTTPSGVDVNKIPDPTAPTDPNASADKDEKNAASNKPAKTPN